MVKSYSSNSNFPRFSSTMLYYATICTFTLLVLYSTSLQASFSFSTIPFLDSLTPFSSFAPSPSSASSSPPCSSSSSSSYLTCRYPPRISKP